MTKNQKTTLLRKVSLFSGVGPKALGEIVGLMTEIDFAPERYVVRQGQVGTGFYLIAAGRARVVRGNNVIARLGPGDFFGELSVLDQTPRMAHVIAEEPTTCLALASWELSKLLEKNPKMTLALLRVVASRLRSVSEQHTH
ncbi:MAG TPA: cyclic nucleotide-binding domain-containing protein [bacterium]